MAAAEPLTLADIDDELEDWKSDDVDRIRCTNCDNEWSPTKHLDQYNTITCSNCSKQAKDELELYPAEPPEPAGGAGVEAQDDQVLDFEAAFQTQTELEEDVDFASMSPGEFVIWFFEDSLSESPVKNAGVFADRCDSKGAIPSEGKMRDVLDDLSSRQGYGNTRQQKWIAELYWGKAKDYASARLGMPKPQVEQYVIQHDADWLKVDRATSRQFGGRDQSDSVVSPWSPQQNQGGSDTTVNPMPAGGNQNQQGGENVVAPQPGGGQTQMPPPQGGDGGNDQALNYMYQMMQQMREERQQMLQAIQEQNQQTANRNQGQESLKEQVQEIAAIQETLEAMQGGDQQDEVVQALQQQINALHQEIQQDETPELGGGGDGGMAQVFAQLAIRDDVDTETLTALASQFGVESDPEVKKAEIEKEMTQIKAENRKEMVNEVFNSLGDAGGQVLATAVKNLTSGEADTGEEAVQQARQQHGQQPQQGQQQQGYQPPGADQQPQYSQAQQGQQGQPTVATQPRQQPAQQPAQQQPRRAPDSPQRQQYGPDEEPEPDPEPEPEPDELEPAEEPEADGDEEAEADEDAEE